MIAGPCSAETEEQVLKIAHALKDTDVTYYRAGIWKPRTRPGMFEGVGALGLKWLERVKRETGMKTATEVANKRPCTIGFGTRYRPALDRCSLHSEPLHRAGNR